MLFAANFVWRFKSYFPNQKYCSDAETLPLETNDKLKPEALEVTTSSGADARGRSEKDGWYADDSHERPSLISFEYILNQEKCLTAFIM